MAIRYSITLLNIHKCYALLCETRYFSLIIIYTIYKEIPESKPTMEVKKE